MAAPDNATPPVEIFRDWDLTPKGRFFNKVTKQELSRAEWEMEVAYGYSDNAGALQFARALSAQAAELEPKVSRPSPLMMPRKVS